MEIKCLYDRLVPISELKPHSKNANRHPPDQIGRLAKILKFQGWRYPVKVSKQSGLVTSGHGRIEAAKINGWNTVPVNFQDYANEDQEKADLHADNAIASWSEFDLSFVNDQLKDFDPSFDVDMFGIKNFQIDVADKFLTDPDSVPEVPKEPKTKPGDLYVLGSHRLFCADSTDIVSVERLMDGQKADMVFTDPPYGMNLDTDYSTMVHKDGRSGNKFEPVIGDDQDFDPGIVLGYFDYVQEVFMFGADYYCQHLPKNGSWVVWDKRESDRVGTKMSELMFGSMFELIWSKQKHKRFIARILWAGGTGQGESEERKGRNNCLVRHHPTQKPIELCEWFFERWGNAGDRVVDLFGGSGSTLIACEKTNRKCFMMELDPHYCDVIVERWEKFTGKTHELKTE